MALNQLHLVAKLAHEQCDEAARKLAEAQSNLQAAQDQLNQLQQYQQDYAEQAMRNAGKGISAQTLLSARSFVGQLDQVIAAQQVTVDNRHYDVERCRGNWLEITRYTQSVERLIELRTSEQKIAQEKRDQRMLDDLYNQRRSIQS